MPVLTGTIADVVGSALVARQVRRAFVRAPAARSSLASGDRLIVPDPVPVDAAGPVSLELEPGPAVLVVDTFAGGPSIYELYVTADMTLLSEAVAESAPAHERSWVESVMVQLRTEAVAAAAAAAEDRVQTGLDREATDEDREQTGLDREATGEDRVATGEDREQTGLDRVAAETARGDAVDAAGDVAAAVAQFDVDFAADMAQFAGIRDEMNLLATDVALDANRAEAAANEFDLTASSSTLAPGASATVTVSGDGPAYSLAFGVPKGDKGDKGDEGQISQAQLDAAVASLVDNAPEALNTLSELSTALGDDPNFATTVSTEIGKRALIDGAPAAYDTLGKLVAALQANELGGSTDAAEMTGALTDQVDVSGGMMTFPLFGETVVVSLGEGFGGVYAEVVGLIDRVATKADIGHKHPVTDLDATGTRSSSTYLRGDGSWATPTNTTYSVPTQAEAEAGTATTARAFSAQRVAQGAIAASGKKDWQGTQAQYDAIGTKEADRTYWIV